MVLFSIPLTIEFSVVIGVAGFLWCISTGVVPMTYHSRRLVNKPLDSASAAEYIAFLELLIWRGLICCAYLDLKNFVHILNRNGIRI